MARACGWWAATSPWVSVFPEEKQRPQLLGCVPTCQADWRACVRRPLVPRCMSMAAWELLWHDLSLPGIVIP